MKLITRDTDYAVRALMYIARAEKEIVPVSEIEKELDLPRPFLRKILQNLQREGILNSVKGNKGGFSLSVSSGKISLSDVINIFQGDIVLTECFLKKKVCPSISKCPVRKKIKGIEKTVAAELKKITVKSLLQCG